MDPRVQDFHDHVNRLCQEAGVELSEQDRQNVFHESVANGFNPEATVRAFDWITSPTDDSAADEGGEWDEDWDEGDDSEEKDDGPNPAIEHLAGEVGRDIERLERQLGRRLLESEREGIAFHALEESHHGRAVNAEQGLERHHKLFGTEPVDMDTHAGRTQYMTQRLADRTPPEEPDFTREFDLDNRADRIAYMEQKAQGIEFEDVGGDGASS
jgi:hypothetical protein